MGPAVRLYAFRYRDPLTGKWVRARYKATIGDIRERYAEWELVGEPETRGTTASFNPFRSHQRLARHVEYHQPRLDLQPQRTTPPRIDADEAMLVSVFLRRYVRYCVRRGRYAAMNGAAGLLTEVRHLTVGHDRP
jgi:hypothetical protein